MTSLIEENRRKLLVLDLDSHQINSNDLYHYFNQYSPIQLIEFNPNGTSAIVHFYYYQIVDYFLYFNTCWIKDRMIRLRRFRSDLSACDVDSSTLRVKCSHSEPLTEESLRQCFHHHQPSIKSIDVICHSQALITFEKFDHVDQILLMPSHMFTVNGQTLQLERILARKKPRRSRWDQQPSDVTTLAVRNPLMYKLVGHIEYLNKQLQERPTQCREEVQRLENEVVTLKNENAQLKAEKKRSFALKDISNRRERSPANENSIKRHRACPPDLLCP